MNLSGKIVLVTGSSSGIGRAVAIEHARRGARVAVHYRKNEQGAKETLLEIKKFTDGKIFKADLEKSHDVESLFKHVREEMGEIDVLVNNAGDAHSGGRQDMDVWEQQFSNIFYSALRSSNELLRVKTSSLRKIINISSLYGNLSTANPEYMQYSAAKAALNNLTVNLAKELRGSVLVNAVAPGYTWTQPWEGTGGEEKRRYESAALINRFVVPEEIAHVVAMLTENDAITGQVITVDGGVSLVQMNQH